MKENDSLFLPFQAVRNLGLRYGSVLGAALGLMGILFYALDLFSDQLELTLGLPLLAGTMLLSMWALRRAQQGFLTLGQGFRVGLTTAVMATLVSELIKLFYLSFIDPQADQRALNRSREHMLSEGTSLEQVNFYTNTLEKLSSPLISIPFTLVAVAFLGAIVALVLAAIMQKRPG